MEGIFRRARPCAAVALTFYCDEESDYNWTFIGLAEDWRLFSNDWGEMRATDIVLEVRDACATTGSCDWSTLYN